MTESTKTYVVTFQHENWEDDGGDHDASYEGKYQHQADMPVPSVFD